ncbi:probable subunit of condensin complex [Lecanosticta acicola]|uniref:Condensin complex subunit 1 n=1 Tax=Lecanosticta acicola TaxID=111012 RepID=A0AAI8YUY7_9PEZI|nr:probable subunit of condensin complex [Lecanosticta acicola]
MSDFNISDALTAYLDDPHAIPTPDADQALVDCENDPDAFSPGLVNSVLNAIVDAIGENPQAILQASHLDSLQFLLKCVPGRPPEQHSAVQTENRHSNSELFALSRQASFLPTASLGKVFDLVISGLGAEAEIVHHEEHEGETEIAQHKQILEIFAFLLQWCISAVEAKSAERPAAPARGKGAKSKAGQKDGNWDPSGQLQTALDTMAKVMKLKLSRIFVTTSERDTFIGLFTRPTYHILESETRVKSAAIRMHAFKVLCVAIKHHGHAYGAQTSIIQNLTYFEHLAEPMAEFLQILAEQYDYAQLAEEVMKELSNKEFSANDTKGPKSVSTFVARLSELIPRVVQRQITYLAKLLESENYTLRCAIIEVCGNLISMLSKLEESERGEQTKGQINAFFDVLQERFLDVNPYCRCRAIQVYAKLCDLDTKYPKQRLRATELAAQSLEDKSSNVRRNAIKLLAKLIGTHPFALMHGGQLSHEQWSERLEACENEIAKLKPPAGTPGLGERAENEQTVDASLLNEPTQVESSNKDPLSEEEKMAALEKAQEQAATAEAIEKLNLTRRYYVEALRFIETLHEASPHVTQLLSSKNKSEVIEAMDFFVTADAYDLETARIGIRRMLRLIWTKGNSDEGKGVQTHLIEAYKGLFFTAPGNFNANDAANYVARNMISLTFGSSPAELTSLEQLLATMMKEKFINDLVIQKLWQVYGVQKKEISKSQRRGAIIVLGMLALADPDIVVKEMETCLRIGLGGIGRRDLVLARYTCIALMRMTNSKPAKGTESKPSTRLTNDHVVLIRLASLLEIESENRDWYGLAEQAIGAIYALSKHPDVLCSEIVRRKTKAVFARKPESAARKNPEDRDPSQMDNDGDVEMSDMPEDAPAEAEPQQEVEAAASDEPSGGTALALSQLLFAVGHIALKQIVHLELCEQDFKRRKADKEKSNPGSARKAPGSRQVSAATKNDKKEHESQDELDLIAGTTEDDFTDAIAHVRERELLYGQQSLLAHFGPLVKEICSNNTSYPNAELQAQAALCLAKLMCLSSEYCEANLGLLITILERSPSSITRSNLVVALGDMAVCFNHLIDENTDFLYRRLSDASLQVKRTCLMTLTFLILAGQVKVKGQLGEMAKCVEDSDERMREMSRMFFAELAGKDNSVYNHFVDMFSLLSADEGLEEDSFRKIIKFLASFIEKDKHAKQLASKLAARLQRAESERQWNDVAYALGLLPHKNEDITKMVAEGCRVVETNA